MILSNEALDALFGLAPETKKSKNPSKDRVDGTVDKTRERLAGDTTSDLGVFNGGIQYYGPASDLEDK